MARRTPVLLWTQLLMPLFLLFRGGSAAAVTDTPTSVSEPGQLIAPDQRRHSLYLEAFGKGGLWGLGYDYLLSDRIALGATGSFYILGGEHISTLSPYLNFYFNSEERSRQSSQSRWMIEAGPQFSRQSVASSVPEWSGISKGNFSGQIGGGWEYRSSYLFRVYGMAVLGDKGLAPWLGSSVGWTF